MPQKFAVISQIMLHSRTYTLLLHAGDVTHSDLSRKKRVFAEAFEVASIVWRTIDVNSRSKHEMNSPCPRVTSNSRSYPRRKLWAPRSRHVDSGCVSSRWKPRV